MGGEREYKSIEECVEEIIDYRGKTPKKSENGIPLITAKIIKNGRIDTPKEFIPVDQYESWMRRGIPKSGDVLITTEAPLGEIAQLDNANIALAQRVIVLRGKSNLLDNTYLRYVLKSPSVMDEILSKATGTTVLGIKQSELKKVKIPLPSLSEQKLIGKMLFDLDERVDLNLKINNTLEEIARAIFKHWFVDFEFPNENDEPYKSSGGEMIDSPLGPIPKGWSTSKFSDAISVNPSRNLKKGVRAKKVRMTDVEPWKSYVSSYTEEIYKSGPKFQNGDVLLARITPSLENGKTSLVSFLEDGEVAYGSTEFIVFAPRIIKSSAYIYCLVRSDYFRDYAIGSMNGSSGRQRVPNDCLDALEIALPTRNLINEFEEIAKTLFSKIDCRGKENQSLSELRDSLLPKLMSGEIRVPVSEKEDDQL